MRPLAKLTLESAPPASGGSVHDVGTSVPVRGTPRG
jgi:hypothetical protein